MEVSVVGRQASAAGAELFPVCSQLGKLARARRSRVCLARRASVGSDACGRRLRRFPAFRAAVRSEMAGAVEKKAARARRQPVARHPQLFVGLPLDAVSDCNTLNHAKAIAAGLKALKLLGADGVELPVWWGVAEREAMGKYNWSSYLALAQQIRDAGLKMRVSIYFHASKVPEIALPSWVSSIGDAEPDIYFTDKEGRRHKEHLSFAVDNLPVLKGKSPLQVYEDFCRSFQAAFSEFLGSTITDVSIGLGPGGELRYPSLAFARNHKVAGVGEFQCYDKHMLSQLKQHAVDSGNPYWGLAGPHDAPQYDESPNTGNFFKENGGSWESAYGDFFLSWYSDQLIAHGDRLLSTACSVFGSHRVTISGKVPVMHSWYKTRSHPSELTAGFYNTDGRDGYDAVAKMFAKNSCKMVLSGMELSDENHPQSSRSSPESLLSQIMKTCKKHNVRVSGENASLSGVDDAFGKIKENLLGGMSRSEYPRIDSFTYQRMGAYFFSPEHWPKFTQFVRSIDRPELHCDDLLSDEEDSVSLSTDTVAGSSRQMQAV